MLKYYISHRVGSTFIVIIIAYWVSWTRVLILALLPQAVPLDNHVTSLNLSCVMGKISDRQCASFQFRHSVILPQLTFLLKASGKPEPCSQSESRYSWAHICLVSTIQGKCLVIQPVPWQLIRGKKRLMEQWVWHFHYCHTWYGSLLGQYRELSKNI